MIKVCYCTTVSITISAFILESAKYLHEEKGWDISFICNEDDAFRKSIPEYIHFYPVRMRRGVNADGIHAVLQMARIFRRERFDLVQYSTPNASLYASIAAWLVGCKVRNYHMMGLRYLGASGIGRIVLKKLEMLTCANSTSVECVSKSNVDMGIKEGLFLPEKATVIWNGSSGGVNLKRFCHEKRDAWRREIRGELGLLENDFVFGFVGRITKDKGINELLEAFFSINDDSKLVLIGRIEDKEALDQKLLEKAETSNRVIILGAVDDIERYYAAIDVLVLPSYREGFGMVVVEAAAVGTPAIVSRIPGPIDAIQEGKTALTVKPKDVHALIESMLRIREMDIKAMGQNAAVFVEMHFDSAELNKRIGERKRKLIEDAIHA